MQISQQNEQRERPGVWHLRRVAPPNGGPTVVAPSPTCGERSSQRVALEHLAERRAAKHASAVIASLQDGMLAIDERGAITDVNAVLCDMTGYTRESLLGKRAPYPFWSRGDARTNQSELEALAGAGSSDATGSLWLTTRSGRRLPSSVRVSAMRNSAGDTLGLVASVRLLPELAVVEALVGGEARVAADGGFARFEAAMRRLATAITDGATLETACDLVAHSVASLTGARAAWILEVSDRHVFMRGSWGHADGSDAAHQEPTITLDALPLARSWLVVQVSGPVGWKPAPAVEQEARAFTAVLPIILGGLIDSPEEARTRSLVSGRGRPLAREVDRAHATA